MEINLRSWEEPVQELMLNKPPEGLRGLILNTCKD